MKLYRLLLVSSSIVTVIIEPGIRDMLCPVVALSPVDIATRVQVVHFIEEIFSKFLKFSN